MFNLEKELKRRQMKEDNVYQIIGSEIKLKRLKLSKTLESVADDFCSTSYLCKIERNTINPNPYFLTKICENLELTKENLNDLYELKQLLIDAVKAFYYEDSKTIDDIFNKIAGFDNYRANIIKIIYQLYYKNYLGLDYKVNELMKLHQNMSDFDILIFSLFYSIYCILENKLKEASKTLKSILVYKYQNEFIYTLTYEYLSVIHYRANTRDYIKYADESIRYHCRYYQIEKIKKVSFYKGLYYIKNDYIEEFKAIEASFLNDKYKDTLKFIYMIYSNDNLELDIFDENSFVSKFYYMLWLKETNVNLFKEKLLEIENDSEITGTEFIYLKYLQSTYIDKYDYSLFLSEVLFPYALNTNNGYLIHKFGDLIQNIQIQRSKYKRFTEIALRINDVNKEINKL